MKKNLFLFLCCLTLSFEGFTQHLYSLKKSNIHFYAGTPMEDIDADNTKTNSFLDLKAGDILISIPNNGFKFKSALMEEHFNENYMESEKFPKSEFKGKILEIEKYDFSKTDSYKVKIEGTLTVHGVSKKRTLEVTIYREGAALIGTTKFIISLADHNIQRPQILWEKLSENIEVTANFEYQLYQKK
jgi:hypothetical protein